MYDKVAFHNYAAVYLSYRVSLPCIIFTMIVGSGRHTEYSDVTPTHHSRGGGRNSRRPRSADRTELLSDQDIVEYNPDNIRGLDVDNISSSHSNYNSSSSSRSKPSRSIFDDV